MMRMKLLTTLTALAILLAGCDVINPAEDIPAYLHIKPFSFTSNPDAGSASTKITEGWVTVNGEFLGAYTLPATLPVLVEGEATVKVEAGMKDNGVGILSEIYPFYTPYTVTLDLKAATVDTIQPTTTYRSDAKFAFIEDFEVSTNIFTDDVDGDSNTKIVSTFSEAFEGQGVGKIVLTKDHPLIRTATAFEHKFSNLQEKSVYVYLELNYKSDVDVAWGIVAYPEGQFSTPQTIYDPVFVARDEWTKIYFNLSMLLFDSKAKEYQITLVTQLPTGKEQAVVLLDNIKLVHF